MTTASFVISCLALAIAAISVWYGRGQKRAAEAAADAAAVLAKIETDRRGEEVADTRRARFELTHRRGDSWVLTNVGAESAYAVHVDTSGLSVGHGPKEFAVFAPGDCQEYLLARTMGDAPDSRLVVTWHQHPDRSDDQRMVRLLGP